MDTPSEARQVADDLLCRMAALCAAMETDGDEWNACDLLRDAARMIRALRQGGEAATVARIQTAIDGIKPPKAAPSKVEYWKEGARAVIYAIEAALPPPPAEGEAA